MLSKKTIETYKTILKTVFNNKDEINDNKELLIKIFDEMTPSYQKIAIPALSFYKNELKIDDDQIALLKSRIKSATYKKVFQYMDNVHVNNFLIYLSNLSSEKEKIILLILFELGVRKFEIRNVIYQYYLTWSRIFNISTKSNKIRTIYLTDNIVNSLNQLIQKYDISTILSWCTPNSIYNTTKKCFKNIGFNGACHDFRRHFAQNLDEKGERLTVIKSLMGHSSIATTSLYIKQNDQELSRIINNQYNENSLITHKEYIKLLNKNERLREKINMKNKYIQSLLKEIEKNNKSNIKG